MNHEPELMCLFEPLDIICSRNVGFLPSFVLDFTSKRSSSTVLALRVESVSSTNSFKAGFFVGEISLSLQPRRQNENKTCQDFYLTRFG